MTISGSGAPVATTTMASTSATIRVIQFGSGITLTDKSRTGIDAVSLNDFENGGTAKVVRHGTPRLDHWYDPPADEAWKIVERAEFLLKLQPRLPYHLIGHNCEHIANMCVSATWIESYQVRTFFGARALGSFGFLLWQGPQPREPAGAPVGKVGRDGVGGLRTGLHLRLQPGDQEVLGRNRRRLAAT